MGAIIPIAMALVSYLSSRQAGGLQKAQSQNLEQQNQEIQYQQQRRKQADPALNALIHLSMGMLPTYQQSQPGLSDWRGFGAPAVGAETWPYGVNDQGQLNRPKNLVEGQWH